MVTADGRRHIEWTPIPEPSASGATCRVWLMQAGTISIPEDFVLLPAPNTNNRTLQETPEQSKLRSINAPDFVFLIEHVPTGDFFLFDLGMRKDLHNLPPYICDVDLPIYDCNPRLPQEILAESSPRGYSASKVKAIILSHLHFDHIGDCGREAFPNAELWIGPSACMEARPGHPHDPMATVLASDFPKDGSRKIVEFTIPHPRLQEGGDGRAIKIEEWHKTGQYEAVDCQVPKNGWKALGSFDLAFDLFGDESAYLIDTPGHAAGHQSLLIRVTTPEKIGGASGSCGENELDSNQDDFVLLAGDSFHHPDLLQDPFRTARPPYSSYTIHADDDLAIDTMIRTRQFAERDNIWVIASHDISIVETLAAGASRVEGLVLLNDWRQKGWKACHGKCGFSSLTAEKPSEH
ncbi:hypothetical protein PV11_03303 [Exophiala sideris]|uniref:Metallo-beta-lactamase domain-containing protein n=1 Tax=Exophiala sideris TaxID=1016849 RepID=A0A0D1XHW8_9EURO|nr:hypothetical protein PV11_03303 [Exophiala sideris]